MRRDWQDKFLASLANFPNVSSACRTAGIGRQTAYDARDADPEFAKAWEDALESSTDDLVGEAYRRARHGTEKPVYHQGEECGRFKEYSDTLTIFLLKAHRPSVYRETTKQIHQFADVSDDDLIARTKAALRRGGETGTDS